jgi:hypothetical protein
MQNALSQKRAELEARSTRTRDATITPKPHHATQRVLSQ